LLRRSGPGAPNIQPEFISERRKFVATAKADTKKINHYKPRVVARQRNNYGYRNALGYAEESRYGRRGLFFR
jgi:hypothetical protein